MNKKKLKVKIQKKKYISNYYKIIKLCIYKYYLMTRKCKISTNTYNIHTIKYNLKIDELKSAKTLEGKILYRKVLNIPLIRIISLYTN